MKFVNMWGIIVFKDGMLVILLLIVVGSFFLILG